jgi:hypothetical protein
VERGKYKHAYSWTERQTNRSFLTQPVCQKLSLA